MRLLSPRPQAIIQRALTDNGVLFSAASQKNIRTVAHEFKTDDSKRVFLLHGERESSVRRLFGGCRRPDFAARFR